ncbi:MAG: LPS export ABC transporter permease LptF [Gammaproteobacteria bacterium]|nr:LPS export ABC transporter permease LptF [Gammaproteobacteria bacterium]MBU2545846.1 LPS export ABC transporter permease LptF [Gammaproteobacteria bacterium]
MIISRYISKEALLTTFTVTTVVVFMFVLNQCIRYLDYIATGKYAADIVLQLILLELPMLFSLLLPLGLFLGILLSYGRLYVDSEMTVLSSCGYSPHQLLATTFKFTVVLFLVVSLHVFFLQPIVATHRDHLMDVAESGSIVQTLLPGDFQSTMHGKRVFYVQSMSQDRLQSRRIFVAEQLHRSSVKDAASQWALLTAQKAHTEMDKATGERQVVLQNGYRYQGVPGQLNWKTLQFQEYRIHLGKPVQWGRNEGIEVVSTDKLIRKALHDRDSMAELQWRISIPLSVFILGLLAVPLSRVKPRHGRFARLLPALLLYAFYVNMIFVSRSWTEEGTVPAWVGVWWIHVLVLGLALYLNFGFRGRKQS